MRKQVRYYSKTKANKTDNLFNIIKYVTFAILATITLFLAVIFTFFTLDVLNINKGPWTSLTTNSSFFNSINIHFYNWFNQHQVFASSIKHFGLSSLLAGIVFILWNTSITLVFNLPFLDKLLFLKKILKWTFSITTFFAILFTFVGLFVIII